MASATMARMAAENLLRYAGRSVTLRVPFLASAGDVTEQLGLATPEFQDVEMGPVVYRRSRATIASSEVKAELMVSALEVERLVGADADLEATRAFFAAAFGILVDGVLMEIVSVSVADVGGETYLCRIGLQTSLLG